MTKLFILDRSAVSSRVLYFGVHQLDYPRNRRLRSYLEYSCHFEVDVAEIEPARGYARSFARLARVALDRSRPADVVFLAEFSLQFAVLGWVAAKIRGAQFVVDWYVGLYETRIEDHASIGSTALRRRIYRLIDWTAAKFADVVITDTDVRAQMLTTRYELKSRALGVPVGAPSWARPPFQTWLSPSEPAEVKSLLKVLYYGNFLPLHGLPLVITALAEAAKVREITITFVGDGVEKPKVLDLVSILDIGGNVRFLAPVPEADLPAIIRQHDVILGVFGSSPKAQSVIANKVWQGLACGKVVVTRASPALDEIAPIVGIRLIQVDASSPDQLSEWFKTASNAPLSNVSSCGVDIQLENYIDHKFEVLKSTILSSTR